MKAKNIILKGLYQSLGLAAYCILVLFIMNNISKLFDSSRNMEIIQGFMFLTIFIVSALVTGSIALAHPIFLASRNRIKEGVFIVFSTAAWSIIFFIVALSIYIIMAGS
ncbi:MAG: hypothetical protein PHU65_08520 [Actinomycetota bacterium]|nr:hypothetical protein [Actinomycetota bacterium]